MSDQTLKSSSVGVFSHPAMVAIITAILTFSASMFLNYKLKQWDTESQIRLRDISDQRQVYSQITGQKAVLVQLMSDIAFDSDAFVFYQASSAKMTGIGLGMSSKGSSKMYSELGAKTLEDSFQKERVLEHDKDQSLTVTQQLFSALGQARLLFPPDPNLDALIQRVENTSDYDYQRPSPMEMLQQTDINAFLTARRKRAEAEIKLQFGQPIDAVLDYLREKIDEHTAHGR